MDKSDYIYAKREFLNDDLSKTACVSAVVPSHRKNKDTELDIPETVVGFPYFSVSDCTDTISLDYSYFGEEEGRQMVAKARRFAEICAEFAEALEKQVKEGVEDARRDNIET